jgi:hypothetical protein
MKTIFGLDEVHTLVLENGLSPSNEIDLTKIPVAEKTPICEMNMFYSPDDYAIKWLFGHEKNYGHYMLEIDLHHAMTPSMRHRDSFDLKSKIEQMGDNTVVIVQKPDNHEKLKNPAMLLVGSSDIDGLMQKILDNDLILGRKGTMALSQLYKNVWPKFKSSKESKLVA